MNERVSEVRLNAKGHEAFAGVSRRLFRLLCCESEVARTCVVRVTEGFEAIDRGRDILLILNLFFVGALNQVDLILDEINRLERFLNDWVLLFCSGGRTAHLDTDGSD